MNVQSIKKWVNTRILSYGSDRVKGVCKYYISTLGVGGGSEGNAYFAYVVRGGSKGKMLILLM